MEKGNTKEVKTTEHQRQSGVSIKGLLGEVNRIKWNSAYYAGAISAYKNELKRAKDAGVNIDFNRLEQFEMLHKDYVSLEQLYTLILNGFIDEAEIINSIKQVVGK